MEECRERCNAYTNCFLFSTISEVRDISDMEETLSTRMEHEEITREVVKLFHSFYGEVIALSTELEYVRKYLSLQKARFGDRLDFDIQADESLMNMEVPKLGLLALTENAITHGMADRTEPLTITIICKAMPDCADLRVINNGNCIPPEKLRELQDSVREESVNLEKNIGLGNLATRLRLIYGDKARLEISSGAESGQETMVKLIIPREVRRHVQNLNC